MKATFKCWISRFEKQTRIKCIDFGELLVTVMEKLFIKCGKEAWKKIRLNELSGWRLFCSWIKHCFHFLWKELRNLYSTHVCWHSQNVNNASINFVIIYDNPNVMHAHTHTHIRHTVTELVRALNIHTDENMRKRFHTHVFVSNPVDILLFTSASTWWISVIFTISYIINWMVLHNLQSYLIANVLFTPLGRYVCRKMFSKLHILVVLWRLCWQHNTFLLQTRSE